MPKKIVRYACNICGREWNTHEEATECESLGIPYHDFEVGDEFVWNYKNPIYGTEVRKVKVIDKRIHFRSLGKRKVVGRNHAAMYKVDYDERTTYLSNSSIKSKVIKGEWEHFPASQ